MTVRIGFDMDGVLADFATAFRDVETRLFGGTRPSPPRRRRVEAQQEEAQEARGAAAGQSPREMRRRRDAVWNAIHRTPDFWTTLQPLDPGAVRRIHELMIRYRWEVFFITQRPATEGQTVQRQTQRWLVEQGFDLPSVLVISGSRGAAAGALRLNFHVDDSAQNCLDVGVGVARPSAADRARAGRRHRGQREAAEDRRGALDRRSAGCPGAEGVRGAQPGLLNRLSKIVGWD